MKKKNYTYKEACTLTFKAGKKLSELFIKTEEGWIKNPKEENTHYKLQFKP
jgi:hypothetical protein